MNLKSVLLQVYLRRKKPLKDSDIQIAVIDLNFEGHEQDGLSLIDHMLKSIIRYLLLYLVETKILSVCVEAMKRPLIEFAH
jgi:hypothetical protein